MNKKNLSIYLSALLFIVACSTNNINPSAYVYQLNEEALQKKTVDTVLIADINFMQPSRHYINKSALSIDEQLQEYVTRKGLKVISNRIFQRQWNKNKTRFGATYNANTGQQTEHFNSALAATLNQVFASRPQLDAVIFSDLISGNVQYTQAGTRTVQWHGVNRKIKVQGLGEGVDQDFSWAESIKGISLVIHVVNREQELVLKNIGGIQIAQTINLQNKFTKMKRRKDLLRNKTEIDEAIRIAMHPLIDMPNFPQRP